MAGKKNAAKRTPAVKAKLEKGEKGKATHAVRLTDETFDAASEVAEARKLPTVSDAVDYLLRYALARRDTLKRNAKKAK